LGENNQTYDKLRGDEKFRVGSGGKLGETFARAMENPLLRQSESRRCIRDENQRGNSARASLRGCGKIPASGAVIDRERKREREG